jgi:hypothetical protein
VPVEIQRRVPVESPRRMSVEIAVPVGRDSAGDIWVSDNEGEAF